MRKFNFLVVALLVMVSLFCGCSHKKQKTVIITSPYYRIQLEPMNVLTTSGVKENVFVRVRSILGVNYYEMVKKEGKLSVLTKVIAEPKVNLGLQVNLIKEDRQDGVLIVYRHLKKIGEKIYEYNDGIRIFEIHIPKNLILY